jgi:membrane protein DedA with SNARE-associated domain
VVPALYLEVTTTLDRGHMTALDPPQPPSPQGQAQSSGPRARWAGWVPWQGRPRARDVCCGVAIVVSAVYAVAAIPLTPALIATHPVLLELLTGSNSSIVAAGAFSDVHSKLQLAVVVAAALPGMMRFDWVYWWAGRLWGHSIVVRLGHRRPRSAALARFAETRGRRFAGPLVALAAFLPGGASTAVYAAAGWAGLPLLPVILFDALGSAAWTALLAVGGYLLGSEGVSLANLASRYAFATVCVLAAAMIAPPVWHSWRERRARIPPAGQPAAVAADPPGTGAGGPATPGTEQRW